MVVSTYLPPRINDLRDDQHSPTPPCHCSLCQAATRAADIRRAEVMAILRRIGAIDEKGAGT